VTTDRGVSAIALAEAFLVKEHLQETQARSSFTANSVSFA